LAHAAYQTALPSTELNPPGAQKRDNTTVIYRGFVNATMGIMNIDSEGSDPRPSNVISRRKQDNDAVQHELALARHVPHEGP
jgi:hypothetical protein